MSKYTEITKELTMWCRSEAPEKQLPFEHEPFHQESYTSKKDFIRMLEFEGWRYSEARKVWFCPACAKKFKYTRMLGLEHVEMEKA